VDLSGYRQITRARRNQLSTRGKDRAELGQAVRTSLGTSGSDPRNLCTVVALLLPICPRDAGMRGSGRAV
jgi:hypothetical protein